MRLKLPEKPYRDDDDSVLKRRLLGAAVLIALAVIILPLVLDGSGSESRFRRVEQLRQEPPRIIDAADTVSIPDKHQIEKPLPPPAVVEPAPQPVSESAPAEVPAAPVSPPAQTGEAGSAQPGAGESQSDESGAAVVQPSRAQSAESATAAAQAAASAQAEEDTAHSDQVVESVAWVIQAGSYAEESNALALRDSLRSAGYPAFSKKVQHQGSTVFRVKVGPIDNRREAGEVQKQVESLIGQSTLIRNYP